MGTAGTGNWNFEEKMVKHSKEHKGMHMELTDMGLIIGFFTGVVVVDVDFKFNPNCVRSGELWTPFECTVLLPFVWWCGFSFRSQWLSFESLLCDFFTLIERPLALAWLPWAWAFVECAKPFTLYDIFVAVSSINGDFIGDISRNSDSESESPSMLRRCCHHVNLKVQK